MNTYEITIDDFTEDLIIALTKEPLLPFIIINKKKHRIPRKKKKQMKKRYAMKFGSKIKHVICTDIDSEGCFMTDKKRT